MIASAVIVFLLLMNNFFSALSPYVLYLQIITFVLILCLWPPICKSIFNFFFRLLKKQETTLWPSYRLTLGLIFLGCISYLQAGIGFYLFIISFYPLPFSNFLSITGAMAGSSLSTIIIFFVPAGIGVRDGTLAYLLSQFLPISFSVLIALLCRLWMTALELLLPLSAFIFDKIHGKEFYE